MNIVTKVVIFVLVIVLQQCKGLEQEQTEEVIDDDVGSSDMNMTCRINYLQRDRMADLLAEDPENAGGWQEFPCELTDCPAFMPNPRSPGTMLLGDNGMVPVPVTEELLLQYNAAVEPQNQFKGSLDSVSAFVEYHFWAETEIKLVYLVPCYEFLRSNETTRYGQALGGPAFRKYGDYAFGEPVLVDGNGILRSAGIILDLLSHLHDSFQDSFHLNRVEVKKTSPTLFIPLDKQIYEDFSKWFCGTYEQNVDKCSDEIQVVSWSCPGQVFPTLSNFLSNLFGQHSPQVKCMPDMIFQRTIECPQDVEDALDYPLHHQSFRHPFRLELKNEAQEWGVKYATFHIRGLLCVNYRNSHENKDISFRREVGSGSYIVAINLTCALPWEALRVELQGLLSSNNDMQEPVTKEDVFAPIVREVLGDGPGCMYWLHSTLSAGEYFNYPEYEKWDSFLLLNNCPLTKDRNRCWSFQNDKKRCKRSSTCSWCSQNETCVPSKSSTGALYSEDEICMENKCPTVFSSCPRRVDSQTCITANDANNVKKACNRMRKSNRCVYCSNTDSCMAAGRYANSPTQDLCTTDFFTTQC